MGDSMVRRQISHSSSHTGTSSSVSSPKKHWGFSIGSKKSKPSIETGSSEKIYEARPPNSLLHLNAN
jgi:hypothetical protein